VEDLQLNARRRAASDSRADTPTRAPDYGELVNLLCAQGHVAEAVELEELWNEAATTMHFVLLCGYYIRNLHARGCDQSGSGADSDSEDGPSLTPSFHSVCAVHSHVLPSEGHSSIEETFGIINSALKHTTENMPLALLYVDPAMMGSAGGSAHKVVMARGDEASMRTMQLKVRVGFVGAEGHDLIRELAPPLVHVGGSSSSWPVGDVLRTGSVQVMRELRLGCSIDQAPAGLTHLVDGRTSALVFPLHLSGDSPGEHSGVLVLGVQTAHLDASNTYEQFVRLIAAQITNQLSVVA
jgi:hypothetical protein